ncbi:MAG: hypothetical protein A2632_01920 [Candidatus Pacebacteria bacterium RIFCSPHIGHO2_01_FULL_46_16]|nr:MAG: hypothetical protein A2632_01920 [Candidatus Pacebacteria bacterium RIFCSPHIGHO2_01_FULL_46_16]
MKKSLVFFFVVIFSLIFFASEVRAGTCTTVGECVDGKKCVKDASGLIYKGSESCGDNLGQGVIGGVTPPKAITTLNNLARIRDGESVGIGLIIFLSRVLRLFTIVTGLFVIANVILAAYAYIIESGSDVKEKVKERFTMTAIGLAIIVGAYTLAAIIGLIFFGDATFILSPELYSALDMQ